MDDRRFRANIAIDTSREPAFFENSWAGAELLMGPEVVLQLGPGMPRCVMVDQTQAGVAPKPKTLKTISAHNGMEIGQQAHPSRRGTLRIGDVVTLRRATSA